MIYPIRPIGSSRSKNLTALSSFGFNKQNIILHLPHDVHFSVGFLCRSFAWGRKQATTNFSFSLIFDWIHLK